MMKTVETPAECVFFTSDLHFKHEWLMKFNQRPYATVKQMEESLIANWNSIVPPHGLTFVLGDIGFSGDDPIEEIFSRLNGEKILIMGNHDTHYDREVLKRIFSEIHELLYVQIFDPLTEKDFYIALSHYPMLDWKGSYRGAWQLFGHVHTRQLDAFETLKTHLFPSQYDVGVDNNNFRPVSFYEVKSILQRQKKDKRFKRSNYY